MMCELTFSSLAIKLSWSIRSERCMIYYIVLCISVFHKYIYMQEFVSCFPEEIHILNILSIN